MVLCDDPSFGGRFRLGPEQGRLPQKRPGILQGQGKFREAALEFRNAVQKDPQFADAHYRLALTYLKLGDLGQAYRMLFNVVTLDPDNLDAQVRLGQIALLAGRVNEAMERAEITLKEKPEDVDALVLKGPGLQPAPGDRQGGGHPGGRPQAGSQAGRHPGAAGPAARGGGAAPTWPKRSSARPSSWPPSCSLPRLLLVRLFLNQKQDQKALDSPAGRRSRPIPRRPACS